MPETFCKELVVRYLFITVKKHSRFLLNLLFNGDDNTQFAFET